MKTAVGVLVKLGAEGQSRWADRSVDREEDSGETQRSEVQTKESPQPCLLFAYSARAPQRGPYGGRAWLLT